MNNDLLSQYRLYLPPPLRLLKWRAHPMDGKLLIFHRDSGLNVLMEGEETAHLERVAPRTLLIAVTNACNLTCHFCYRNLKSPSQWRYDTLMDFCRQADEWGVLEVAFGGGEPMLFPRWSDFIRELYDSTQLCINFTSNGILITDEFLRQVAGKYGQIRISLYEDNHYEETLWRLVRNEARFGVNWLITPAELASIDSKFDRLMEMGVRDFLLIGYKGNDKLHLNPSELTRFGAFVNRIYAEHGNGISIKLDICWGDSLPDVPRLFVHEDCGAGDDFLSITSDQQIKPCSFHESGIPFQSMEDVKRYWQNQRRVMAAAPLGGCARLPNRGLTEGGSSAFIHLAAIQ